MTWHLEYVSWAMLPGFFMEAGILLTAFNKRMLHLDDAQQLTFVITLHTTRWFMTLGLGWIQGNIMLGSFDGILFVSKFQGNQQPFYGFLSTQEKILTNSCFDYWCIYQGMHWLNFSNQFSRCTFKSLFIWVQVF